MRVPFSMQLGIISAAAGLLVACGGGGGANELPDANGSAVTATVDQSALDVTPGKSFIVQGAAVSQPNAMATMSWGISKLTTGAPDMVVVNGDCANGTRNGTTVNDITKSNWACDAVLTAPAELEVDSTYRITFTGADAKGNSSSAFRDVTIVAGGGTGSAPPVAHTTDAISLTAGDDAGLSCVGSGGKLAAGGNYVYNWSIKSNPDGLPLTLNSSGDGQLTFKAPAVRAATSVTLQCRVIDDNMATGTADAVVSIAPAPAAAAIANAGSTQTVGQGATVTLDASASSGPTGSTLYYLWQQTEGPSVSLSNATSVAPNFAAPMVDETTRLTFQVTAMTTSPANPANAAPSELATVSVYVTPQAPLVLGISAASVVDTGTAVTLQVSVTPAGGTLYYAWTQVSGPTVVLGGANTAIASFLAPDVAGSYVDTVFSVSVSRKPLTQAMPAEIYTADVVVRTNP